MTDEKELQEDVTPVNNTREIENIETETVITEPVCETTPQVEVAEEAIPATTEPEEHKVEATADSDGIGQITDLMKANKEFVIMTNIIGARNKVNEMKSFKAQIENKAKAMCPDEKLAFLEARVADIDSAELEKLDPHNEADFVKIKSFYETDDGGSFEFSIEFDDARRKREFYKDFLLYVKNSKEEYSKIDIAMEKINKDIADIMEENKDILGDVDKVTSISEFYYDYMNKLLADETVSDTIKVKINKILSYRAQGISLEFIRKEIKAVIDAKGSAKTIRYGYTNSFLDTASKVDKILKTKFAKYKLNLNLPAFVDLEERIFTDYAKYNNLFMFILMRYIKHNYENFTGHDMITITEVLVNLGYYKYEPEDRPACSVEFTAAVNDILSLVVNN